MKTNLVNMTIADYCEAFERNQVQIDKTYQRSPDIWPPAARSYLIESILKGFPIPKLALHQKTNLKSKKTMKFVVDGQQRSSAIRDFYGDKLRLSRTLELAEAAGKRYAQLPPELQDAFLTYVLYFDQFEGSGEKDVREHFRRINSFTAPLNPEEKRHARYQGNMKWFLYSLTQRYGEALVNLGVLPKQSAIRMQDTKFLAELTHALLNGVTTTSKRTLDTMYRSYEKDEVPDADVLRRVIDDAINQVLEWQITETALTKTHVFYSLILAVVLAKTEWPQLLYLGEAEAGKSITDKAGQNLLRLAAALGEPETFEEYEEFIGASSDQTNVKAQRETRVRWLHRAITSETI